MNTVDVEGVLNALRNVGQRSELLAALNDAKRWLSSPETLDFQKYRILKELINILEPTTLGLLTANEFKGLFTKVVHAAPVTDALIVFIDALHFYGSSQKYRLQHILILLDEVEKTRLSTLLIESITKNPDNIDWNVKSKELCKLLGQTACLVQNAFADLEHPTVLQSNDAVLDAYLNNHWVYMLKAIKAALLDAVGKCQNGTDVNLQFVSGIVYQLCRGDSATFLSLVNWLGLHAEDPLWGRIGARLFTDSSNGMMQLEDLLRVVVVSVKDGEMLQKLFGHQLHENRVVKRVFFDKSLFVKVYPAKIAENLAVCLEISNHDTEVNGPWSTLHSDVIKKALRTWADIIHVNHSSDEQQRYVEYVLLYFVKHANKTIRQACITEAVNSTTHGVNLRLQSHSVLRRVRGMYVAEVLTKWLSLGTELNFEYPSNDSEFLADLKEIVDGKSAEEAVSEKKSENVEKEPVELEVQQNIEADGELDSDDDDFPQYEIPLSELNLDKEIKDEDYHRVETPYYIRDCMEQLNERDDYAKFEAAFDALNPLIRRRAIGFDQSAEELLRKLIDLTDRFGTENFQEKRMKLIVSCLVMSPHLGAVAVDVMYSRRCSMMTRYAILYSLAEAATEYSSPDPVVREEIRQVTQNKVSDAKVMINGELVPRTKYFKKAPVVSGKENKFTPLASSFFYPLTAIHQHREHLDLMGRDSELLSRILFCLAHLIICSGACPCTTEMVSTLIPNLLLLRHHSNFAVRHSVLFCYNAICLSLSKNVLLEFYGDVLMDWYEYAAKMANADPATECRQFAQMVVRTIAELCNSNDKC